MWCSDDCCSSCAGSWVGEDLGRGNMDELLFWRCSCHANLLWTGGTVTVIVIIPFALLTFLKGKKNFSIKFVFFTAPQDALRKLRLQSYSLSKKPLA